MKNLIFPQEPAISTHVYATEAFLYRTVVSIGYRNYSKECEGPLKIGLMTQLSANRFDMLDLIAHNWKGPMNIAVYVKKNEVLSVYTKISNFLMNSKRQNVIIHLVVAEGQLYPVNWLRNLVIQNSTTEYIFMIDGDFVPSPNLEETMRNHFKHFQATDTDNTNAIIVPAFEITDPDVHTLPSNRDELLQLISEDKADVFHRSNYPDGHRIWKFDRWRYEANSYFLRKRKACTDKSEPYIAIKRTESPLLPETLLERRKNKIAYFFELCNADKRFAVLANEFVIHKLHPQSLSNDKVKLCVDDAWDVYRDFVIHKYGKYGFYQVSLLERWRNFKHGISCLFMDHQFVFLMSLPFIIVIYGYKYAKSRTDRKYVKI